MGVGKFVYCNHCKKEWTHYNGTGMDRAFRYCDRCGASKSQKHEQDIVPDVNNFCPCGGTFLMESAENERIICPDCQSDDLTIGDSVIYWD